MADNRFARINEANKVIAVVEIGDDIENPTSWLQQIYHTTNTFVQVPGNSRVVGPNFSYGTVGGPNVFAEPQPYDTWTSTTTDNILTWYPPVAVPTKINNDMPENTNSNALCSSIFTWDNDNVRWLNGLGQYWDAANSNWVDI